MGPDFVLDVREDDDEDCAYESSGNAFADVELPNAAELYGRSQLVNQIADILGERKLTDQHVAELFEITAEGASDLVAGEMGEFSLQQLFAFLEALGYDAEITVHPRKPMKRVSLPRRAKAHR